MTGSRAAHCSAAGQRRATITWPPRMFWACSGSNVQVLWGFTGSAMSAIGKELDLARISTISPFSSMLPELCSVPAQLHQISPELAWNTCVTLCEALRRDYSDIPDALFLLVL